MKTIKLSEILQHNYVLNLSEKELDAIIEASQAYILALNNAFDQSIILSDKSDILLLVRHLESITKKIQLSIMATEEQKKNKKVVK
jgi:hypothetical protein